MNEVYGRFWIEKRNGQVIDGGHPCYETRRASVVSLVRDAVAQHKVPDFDRIMIWTSDRPEDAPSKQDWCFSRIDSSTHVVVPDFVFGNWPQVGIVDYDQVAAQIQLAGQTAAKKPTVCGWMGNAALSQARQRLLLYGTQHPLSLEIVDTGHWKPSTVTNSIQLAVSKHAFKSLPDLVAEYGVLIDIEGHGWSGRLKLLLFSNRPLLIQERPWNEFYWNDLVPFQHYIPVKRDLSDLLARLQWVQTHPEQARAIAARACAYATEHLMRRHAVDEWGKRLLQHAALAAVPRLPDTPVVTTMDSEATEISIRIQYFVLILFFLCHYLYKTRPK